MTLINHKHDIKKYFPFFSRENKVHYLDSGATSLKPKSVIDTVANYYTDLSSSVHRGAYSLSDQVTDQFEKVRKNLHLFLGSKTHEEIVFTGGATDSCNLVAQCLGEFCLNEGDEVVVTAQEHHANFIPWQQIAKKRKAHFKVIPLTSENKIDLEAAKKIVTKRTKILAFLHVSNVLGIINPVEELITLAQENGAYTFIDGAQAIPHFDVNVQELGCDFYTFSPHKALGPTGIGVLYGRKKLLDEMPPYRTGGHMIAKVTAEETTWNVVPEKFEAGTPNIAGVMGIGAAIDFLKKLDRVDLMNHELKLARHLAEELQKLSDFAVYNPLDEKSIGLVSFSHKSIHPHDVAFIADSHGVCLRSGHLCAQPLMQVLGVPALTRACLYIYNDENDIEQFLKAMYELEETFK